MAAAAAPAPALASRRAQAAAVGRRLATLQARRPGANTCLLASPVLFCLLLLVLQHAINHTLTSAEFTCGCQCTKCCVDGVCSAMHNSTCPHACLAHNASNCGVQFSAGVQAAFCDVPQPSIWPPITQVPPTAERAAPARPKLTILHTPGRDARLSSAATAALVPAPALQAAGLAAASAHVASFRAEMGDAADTLPGELAAMLGLSRLGSTAVLPHASGLFVDTALVGDGKNLQLLVPDGACARLGLAGRSNVPLAAVLQALVNASNPPAAAALLNARLQAMADSAAAAGGPLAAVVAAALNCSDVVLSAAPDSARLQRALYCGNVRARCGGKPAATSGYAAGVEWRNTSATAFAPLLLFNDSFAIADENQGTHYTRAPAPLLNMAVNGWLAAVFGPGVSAELVGVGALPKRRLATEHDFTAALGSVLGCWVLQLLLPVFVCQLVYERERRLRLMQKQHGLGDAAYALVHAAWFSTLYAVFAAAFALLGAAAGLNMFKNHAGIQVVLYALWGACLIALSFLAAACFSSARTAAVACYLAVFASGLCGFMLLRYLLDLQAVDARRSWWAVFLEVLPPLALYRGLYELGAYGQLGAYRGGGGMTVASLTDAANGTLSAWAILAGAAVLLALAAWWCEQVLAAGTGNRRHPLFFLGGLLRRRPPQQPGARNEPASPRWAHRVRRGVLSRLAPWAPGRRLRLPDAVVGAARATADSCSSLEAAAVSAKGGGAAWTAAGHLARAQAEPADVAAERARVAALPDGAAPLMIRGLRKLYPGRDGQPPKLAVARLDLAVADGECFGLLGPNGAGKSTTLGMLTGLLRPTAGTALVGGADVARDARRVFGNIGVCPQHDVLWEALTGREHLLFYGRLKGLTGAALDAAVAAGLAAVSLSAAADKRAGSYSGGMQRRLSVAISFLGDPRVVYLDEPSTGLDPASRRALWTAVAAAKPGRAIVLTTHSMEEAEVLCDRLGIFVDGRLACIGSPRDVTARFCGFLLLTLTVPVEQEAAARELVRALAPGALVTYSVSGTLKCELPAAEASLARVFRVMGAATAAGGGPGPLDVANWSVATASLEDCFIRFARAHNLAATT